MVIEPRVVQFSSEIKLENQTQNRTRAARLFNFEVMRMISALIIYMKKLLSSDWLR